MRRILILLFCLAMSVFAGCVSETPRDGDRGNDDERLQTLFNQGRHQEFLSLAQEILAERETALGPDHPDVARYLNIIGLAYQRSGDYARAEPLQQRALTIFEKAFGPEHPVTAYSLNSLAWLYGKTGDYAKAEQLLKRSLSIQEKFLGVNHPDTALTRKHLDDIHEAMSNRSGTKIPSGSASPSTSGQTR